jgi:beta-glucosidase
LQQRQKHFAVYSVGKGAREGQARTDPQVSPREIENILLPPFEAAIKEAKVLGVMSSYNDVDSIPVTGSDYWLTQRLRRTLAFEAMWYRTALRLNIYTTSTQLQLI